jgi:hypothetical protein
MTLLDHLKKEALKLQQSGDKTTEAARLKARYDACFHTPMLAIQHYLSELSEQLKILDYEVKKDYTLPGIGLVKDLNQSGYTLNMDSSENPRLIHFRFNSVADREREYSVTPKLKADETRDFLESQGMRYSEWPIRNHKQRIVGLYFQLTVLVKVNFVFQVDLELDVIKLFIYNFNDFRIEKSLVKPERVDDAWLDNLGNYILRKRESLFDLEMDESLRSSLRQRLQEEERQRHKELQKVLSKGRKANKTAHSQSILNRFKFLSEKRNRK